LHIIRAIWKELEPFSLSLEPPGPLEAAVGDMRYFRDIKDRNLDCHLDFNIKNAFDSQNYTKNTKESHEDK
jgi:hypothetical protein